MIVFHQGAALELRTEPGTGAAAPAVAEAVQWLTTRDHGYRTLRFDSGMDLQAWMDAFRTHFRNLDAAGGLVHDEAGRILTIFRRGNWDLPKGKVDPGETPDRAALREVREETGLQALRIEQQLPATYHVYHAWGQWHFKTTFWYRMRGDAAERLVPQTDEDITAIEWTPWPQALATTPDRPTWPSVRWLLQAAAPAGSTGMLQA